MNDIETVKGGPIELSPPPSPIARARQHIAHALACLRLERAQVQDSNPNRALDITHIIHDLLRIEGNHDGMSWAYPMSIRRLEAQEKKP